MEPYRRLTDEQMAASLAAALLHRIVRFGRALREAGIDANPGRLADFCAALPHVELRRRDDFYFAARATLLSRPDQREAFDGVFARFWPPGRVPIEGIQEGASGAPSLQQGSDDGDGAAASEDGPESPRLVLGGTAAIKEEAQDESPGDGRHPASAMMSYSQEEVLREKNFGDFTEEELERARKLMERMRWQAARRLTRRSVRARRGTSLDLRRTVRRAFTTGGETLTWAERRRKLKPRPLVLICDVSGSMERYTRLLLQFLHTVSYGTGATV